MGRDPASAGAAVALWRTVLIGAVRIRWGMLSVMVGRWPREARSFGDE